MRSLIEAGVALLIVYIFIKYKQGEAPGQALTDLFAPIQGTPASNFLEDPGAASADFELSGSNSYGTMPPTAPIQTSLKSCGCC